jgi:linoleoyl-CoA desaturase
MAITFDADSGFYSALKLRVRACLRSTGRSPRGGVDMILKTVTILLWLVSSYLLLVFAAHTWWQGALLSLSLAFAVAGTGFAIQHDANHGAYSHRRWVNRLMGFSLDLLGASSYLWHWKHNILHHTYTNIEGADHDLDAKPFGRLAPEQTRRLPHRFQHIYMWALYGFMLPKWQLVDDFQNALEGRLENNRIPRPRGWALAQLLFGKIAFFAWALAIPMAFHRWWVVLLFYGGTSFSVGVILAVVFQLAHCIEEAEFPHVSAESSRIPVDWARHQLKTTVDFARGNRAITWYLGGLNYQIEHHLFPRICHIHYPAIAGVVEETCAEFGVPYLAHEGVLGALSSHWRWLRRMGQSRGEFMSSADKMTKQGVRDLDHKYPKKRAVAAGAEALVEAAAPVLPVVVVAAAAAPPSSEK